MIAGIHLDVQLYHKVYIFLKEGWQARNASNIPDCLILLLLLLLLLRKKILKMFRVCGGGRIPSEFYKMSQEDKRELFRWKVIKDLTEKGAIS